MREANLIQLENKARGHVPRLKPMPWGWLAPSKTVEGLTYPVLRYSNRTMKCMCLGNFWNGYCYHSLAAILIAVVEEEGCDIGDLDVFRTRKLLRKARVKFCGAWNMGRFWVGRKSPNGEVEELKEKIA